MDYLYSTSLIIDLETNSLYFSSKKNTERLFAMIKKRHAESQITLSFSSVNNTKDLTAREAKKTQGFFNLLKDGLKNNVRVRIFINFTKKNHKSIPYYLKQIIKKHKTGRIEVELGLPSMRHQTEKQLKETTIDNFSDISKKVNESIDIILKDDIDITLTNLPLCILDVDLERLKDRITLVKYSQMDIFDNRKRIQGLLKPNKIEEEYHECNACIYSEKCRKVQKEYLEKGILRLKSIKKKQTMVLFDITLACNDNCAFCCNKQLMDKAKEHKSGKMSLKEIKNNAYYLMKKFKPQSIIITGGEPTMHPKFWEIMDFFYRNPGIHVALNTNAIVFHETKQAYKLFKLFENAKLKDKSIEISLSTINTWPPDTRCEKKIRGVINAMHAAIKTGTSVRFFIYFTRDNYKHIPRLIDIIIRTLKQYTRYNVVIEIGNLSIGKPIITDEQFRRSTIKYDLIRSYATRSVENILSNKKIGLHLYNMPPCLLDINHDRLIEKSIRHDETEEHWLHVNYLNSMEMIRPQGKKTREIFVDENLAIIRYCQKCKIKDICNKIQQEYLDRGLVKELKPICTD